MFLRIIKTTVILLGVFVWTPVLAQLQSFSITQNPQNPNPGETIFLSISAYEFNVDLSKITWSVDGKVKETGLGRKTFSLVAPANGKTSTVDVEVITQNGQQIKNSVTFSPSNLDIIWEAIDSYTPPFYRGKSLPISQSQVKIVAIPIIKNTNGSLRKMSDFVFTWKKDSKNFPGQSGLAKNTFSYANELLEQQNRIDVTVTDGTKSVSGSILMTSFEPEIIFYGLDSITALPKYSEAIGKARNVGQSRIGIIAEPYFLSSDFKTRDDIKTVWKLNNEIVNGVSKNNLLVNASATTGSVAVSFDYDDTKKLFRDFSFTSVLNITN